ncbi:unnamed protein product [Paramecium primaurelia]|uniref:Uncharacterized protein n=1 Tax=Paramecium primaurelia TaxID=5886 RepID=A0A8S1QEE5_PARPR|nr:unnamed protein product [Paramecium primaurelia]CAD8114198.1 unnamed protein product [Paramecium primaurelia]
MFTSSVYNGSYSRIPNGGEQNQMKVSSDQVIFIANFNRHLMNSIKTSLIFHQALLVVTSNIDNEKISCDKKYHLVEYGNDSIVKGYQINIRIINNPKYLKELTKFEDEQYEWEKMSIKQQFDIDTLNITVNNIMQKMQDVANQNGLYNIWLNNCQSVANQLTEQLLLENISKKNLIFLALVEKQDGDHKESESSPHSALFVATQNFNYGSYRSNFLCYIVEYLNDGKVHAYQFYPKNQTNNLINLNQFDNGKSYWETKTKIHDFYIKQTVQNIIDTMKQQIRFFQNNSTSVAKDAFDKINKIQEDEKQRLEEERRMRNVCEQIKKVLIVIAVLFIIYKIFSWLEHHISFQ